MRSLARTSRSLAGSVRRTALGTVQAVRTRARPPYSMVYYVVEGREWSIVWDGRYITRNVRAQTGTDCRTTATTRGISRQVVHFGSRPAFFAHYDAGLDGSNRSLFTWFHGDGTDGDPATRRQIGMLPTVAHEVSRIVTSCAIGRERLKRWGVPDEKIVTIPLGVELDRFRPVDAAERASIREALGVPADAMCIGSFQKDGVGWGEGNAPKLVKGPDIFLDAVGRIAERHKIFVLLTGPARGYVKRGLAERGIPYAHTFLRDFRKIVRCYQALDLYMVTSRDEGGPKAILEAMACGVPLVSTRVGMAPDVIDDGVNGYLTDVEDVDGLAEQGGRILTDPTMQSGFRNRGLASVRGYGWDAVALRYYSEAYAPLLGSVG